MKIEPLPIHPVACCWPEDMTGQDWEDFCKDVKANGLKVPIETWQGQVIDGRRRQKACFKVGVLPIYREWDGRGSMTGHVASLNFHRRDLDPETKDIVAAKLIPFFEEEANQRMKTGQSLPAGTQKRTAASEAAKSTGASERGTYRAAKVLRNGAPELVQALESGKVSTSKAAKLADLTPREQIKAIQEEGKKIMRKSKARDRREAIDWAQKQALKIAKRLKAEAPDLMGIIERFEIAAGLLSEG